MKNIKILFNNKEWNELSFYPIQSIVRELDFKKAMIVAYQFLYNDDWDEVLQNFAVKLIYKIKDYYSSEWNSNWRNEAFLGLACDITLKYEERYNAYKKAFEKVHPPPPELLIELAGCCYCPGPPPISYEEAIDLLKNSIIYHPYKQAAALLKSIYSSKKDEENENYWSKMIDQITDENLPSIEPLFFKEV